MRAYYPAAPFETLRRLERIEASHAAAIPRGRRLRGRDQRATGTWFRAYPAASGARSLWRIDLVETWKNLFFDGDGNYWLRNSNTPYAFGLKQFGTGQPFDVAAVPLRDVPLARWLEALDRDDTALIVVARGAVAAQRLCRSHELCSTTSAHSASHPRDPMVLETFGERARYLGFPEFAIPALAAVGRGVEMSLADAYNEAGDRQGARRWIEQALEQNPYDLHAFAWQRYLAERDGNEEEVQRMHRNASEAHARPRSTLPARDALLPAALATLRARCACNRRRHPGVRSQQVRRDPAEHQ